jgi:hypothetical protein
VEFFSGFKWAVPVAFSDAVAACRFEEGDMLYDSPAAHMEPWADAKANINYSLQVRFPARGSGTAESAERYVFKGNWGSEVRVDVHPHKATIGENGITTTQGRLYSALWKGGSRYPEP